MYQVQVYVYTRSDTTLDFADYSTAAMPVRRTPQRPRPSVLDRPLYPPAQARAIANASTSHSADPASCDPAVKREDLREGVQRICDTALKEGLDLVRIHEDQDPDYFIKDGVQAGVAKRFVRSDVNKQND
jgi:hypothetical protein